MRRNRSCPYDRREFLAITAGVIPGGILPSAYGFYEASPKKGSEIANHLLSAEALAKLVKPHDRWGADEMHEFICHVSDEARLSLKKALEIVPENANVNDLKGISRDIAEIQDYLLWVSEHVIGYLWKSKAEINYHQVVQWVAEKYGISKSAIAVGSTFALEHAILRKIFADLWDKLSHEQRLEVLKQIDPDNKSNGSRTVLHSGREALHILLQHNAVKCRGFEFYIMMSKTICAIAKLFNVTLPFAVYTTASKTVAFLTGPVGRAILELLEIVVEVAIAGQANLRRTTAFVLQMHLLRVAALMAADWPQEKIFTPSILHPGGGRLEANRQVAGEWETFRMIRNANGTWSFAAYTGYLCAEQGGGGTVVANRDAIGPWEEWTLVWQPGGKVSLRSKAGYYLCAEEGGTSVVANRTEAREWEQFILRTQDTPDGKTCTIETWEGRFLSAQPE